MASSLNASEDSDSWNLQRNLVDIWDAYSDADLRSATVVSGELGFDTLNLTNFLVSKTQWTDPSAVPWGLWKLVILHYAFEREDPDFLEEVLGFVLAREAQTAHLRPDAHCLPEYHGPPQTAQGFIQLMVLLAKRCPAELRLDSMCVLFGVDPSPYISFHVPTSLTHLRTDFLRHIITTTPNTDAEIYQSCILYLFYTMNMYKLDDFNHTSGHALAEAGVPKECLRSILAAMQDSSSVPPPHHHLQNHSHVHHDQSQQLNMTSQADALDSMSAGPGVVGSTIEASNDTSNAGSDDGGQLRLIVEGQFVCEGVNADFRVGLGSKGKAKVRIDVNGSHTRITLRDEVAQELVDQLRAPACLRLAYKPR